MNFTQFFIKRPAFTIVLSLLISLVGLIAYINLPLRWVPNIKLPEVGIETTYPGANASLVESQVTTPLESALTGIDGIEVMSSNSKQGESSINITFKYGRNINAAVEDVRSALQGVSESFPTEVKQPVVMRYDADENAILYLAFSDSQRSAREVSDYVEQFIKPQLQTTDGVASVQAFGDRTSAVHIWIDPQKMAAFNVTVDDINKVLTEQNIAVPSGQIRGKQRVYNVVTNATLKTASQFNDLIIRDDKNQIVRLQDIAKVVVDAANLDSAFRVRGQAAIGLAIIPQSNANPLDVERNILKTFAEIRKELPTGMQGNVVFNQASYIRDSLHHVYESLLEAIILVLVVIFLFLASWRAAFIPIITIPICLISTFAILYTLDFSVNTITLMALVLAIGLVVDDAIVMLENISRYLEAGLSPLSAAIKGSKEIVFPIIAMTLTLAAVYLPLALTGGVLSTVFSEFAITLAAAVLISGVVALTLSPMMCSRLLRTQQQTEYSEWLNKHFVLLQNYYANVLSIILNKKKWIFGILLITGLIGTGIYVSLAKELVPMEDIGVLNVYMSTPHNSSFALTDKYSRQLEAIANQIPEAESYFTQIGSWTSTNAFQIISLVPENKRSRSAAEIAVWITQQTNSMIGVDVGAQAIPPPLTWYTGGSGANIAMEIMSPADYKTLHNSTKILTDAAKKYPGFLRVDNQLKWDSSQFEVNINREKAADMKVPMQAITSTISTLLAGKKAGYFEYGGKQYDILMQMNESALADPNIISKLYVRNDMNKMVPLSGLVSVNETSTPEVFPHFDRLRSDTVYATLAPGYSMAQGIQALEKIAKTVLPENAKYTFSGEAREFLEASGKTSITFILALIFIYLILVAQFESFIDPLIILLTVPFAMIGALLTLKLAGGSLNIYSNIGLVTLIGLIAKHGILITEFANRERQAGQSIQQAVVAAAKLRLRPILMTTAAMVLGALPLACASGPGAASRHQIGWVIVGGLLLGTFFSLIVVPVAYTILAKFKSSELESDPSSASLRSAPSPTRGEGTGLER